MDISTELEVVVVVAAMVAAETETRRGQHLYHREGGGRGQPRSECGLNSTRVRDRHGSVGMIEDSVVGR